LTQGKNTAVCGIEPRGAAYAIQKERNSPNGKGAVIKGPVIRVLCRGVTEEGNFEKLQTVLGIQFYISSIPTHTKTQGNQRTGKMNLHRCPTGVKLTHLLQTSFDGLVRWRISRNRDVIHAEPRDLDKNVMPVSIGENTDA